MSCATLEHEWADRTAALAVHLERHGDDPSRAPPWSSPTASATKSAASCRSRRRSREHGFNALLVDRLGHGISEGRRGDATLEDDLAVLELAIGDSPASAPAGR